MKQLLIKNAQIINEGRTYTGSVLVKGDKIAAVYEGAVPPEAMGGGQVIDATGKWLIPGAIDDQVHFREPGVTHKGDIFSESRAAVAGGGDHLYGYAQYKSADYHAGRAGMETKPGGRDVGCQLLLFLWRYKR